MKAAMVGTGTTGPAIAQVFSQSEKVEKIKNMKRNNESKYKLSVIVPIYNTEEYLEECIDSIINQTLGFDDNIQLILINDGSTDSSESICLQYKADYPDNIIYRYQSNKGVSAARNLGLDLAQGEYIIFFDSDDFLKTDVFEKTIEYFDSPEAQNVDVLSFPIEMIGAKKGPHILNYKYSETRVVNLKKEYTYVQLMTMNCLIRKNAIGKLRFRTDINYMEDALFINEILLKKCLCAVVAGTCCYKRERFDNSNLSHFDEDSGQERYLITPIAVHEKLLRISEKYHNEIERFIQYTLAYEIQWRICEALPKSMNSQDISEYNNLLTNIIKKIEDQIILSQKNLGIERKAYLLQKKHGPDDWFSVCDGKIYTKEGALFLDMNASHTISCNVLANSVGVIEIKGTSYLFSMGLPFQLRVEDEAGNKSIAIIDEQTVDSTYSFNGEIVERGHCFRLNISPEGGKSYGFYFDPGDDLEPIKTKPFFKTFGKLNHNLKNSYWRTNDYVIKLVDNRICCYKYSLKEHIKSEYRLIKEILKLPHSDKYEKAMFRISAFIISKALGRKTICLLYKCDTQSVNIEEIIKVVEGKEYSQKKNRLYLLEDKRINDCDKVNTGVRTVQVGSLFHKILLLNAAVFISTIADRTIMQPFRGQAHCLFDLFNYRFVLVKDGKAISDTNELMKI